MILKSMEIRNFRLFSGLHKINFSHNQNLGTLFYGNNNSGKSTLIDAYMWCLFGKVINNTQILNFNSPETSVSVRCEFLDDSGKNIVILREEGSKGLKSIFDIFVEGNPVQDKYLFLDKYFYPHFLDFHYFNLENSNYFEDYQDLKRIMANVTQLDSLMMVKTHTSSIKQRISTNIDYGDFMSSLPRLKEELKRIDEDISHMQDHDKSIRVELDGLMGQLNPEVLQKFNEIEELKSQLVQLDKIISNASKSKYALILNLFSKSNFFNQMLNSFNSINISDNRTAISQEFNELKSDIKSSLLEIKKIDELKSDIYTIENAKEVYELTSHEILNIEVDLENVVDDNIDQINNLKKELAVNFRRLIILKEERKHIIYKIKLFEERLDRIEKEMKKLRAIDEFFNKLSEMYEYLIKNINLKVINDFQNSLKNLFFQISSEDYMDLIIDDEYNIKIIKNSDLILPPFELSSSEKMIFYASFLISLRINDIFNVPLFLDDLLNNFDEDTKYRLLNVIEGYDSKIQFILFSNQVGDVNIIKNHLNDFKCYNLIRMSDSTEIYDYEG